MLLPFSRAHKDETPTNFRKKIQETGTKYHTIRSGKRWKPGDIIHFWDGSPRNVRLNPRASEFFISHNANFSKDIPIWAWDPVADPEGKAIRIRVPIVEDIDIIAIPGQLLPAVYVGGDLLSDTRVGILASRDGLSLKQFCTWFSKTPEFSGQIIHWTNTLIYNEEKAQKSPILDQIDQIGI